MQNQRPKKPKPKTCGKTTLQKGGRNPPNVTLEDILTYLSEYFHRCYNLEEVEKYIKNKYGIDTKPGDWWSEDDIKRVWGKTQRLKKISKKSKKCFSLSVALQIMNRRQGCNESETKSDPDQIENLVQDLQLADNSSTFYIRIPVLKMFGSESDSSEPTPKNVTSTYKLIDGVPSSKDIRVKKYYVMSYNSETNNAEWVYEILNRDTLVQNDVTNLSFGQCMQNPGYDQGHLAAAANHMWCQEAYNSTFLFSNISPQFQMLNISMWNILENYCRKIIDNDKENKIRNVHVYTGPILNDSDSEDEGEKRERGKKGKGKKRESGKKGKGGKWKKSDDDSKKKKAVPASFFKVIIVENNNGTVEQPECYVMPNKASELIDEKKVKDEAKLTSKIRLESNKKLLEHIKEISKLTFMEISCNKGETDSIRKVTWTGEKGNGESCSAKIEVRITTPHT